MRKESLYFKVDGKSIADLVKMDVIELGNWLDGLTARLSKKQQQISIEIIKEIRKNSKKVLALGDCAVTGNISAMKNLVGTEATLEKGYFDLADHNKGYYPDKIVPKLLDKVIPLNEAIDVDFFVPGCPTPADAIYEAIKAVLEDREIDTTLTRFGK